MLKTDPVDLPIYTSIGSNASIVDRITIQAPTQGGSGYTDFSFTFDEQISGFFGNDASGNPTPSGVRHYFDVSVDETGEVGDLQVELFGQWFDVPSTHNFARATQDPGGVFYTGGSFLGSNQGQVNFRFLGDDVTFDFFLGATVPIGQAPRYSGEKYSGYGVIETDIILPSGSTLQSQSGIFSTQDRTDVLQEWRGTDDDNIFSGSGFNEEIYGEGGNDTLNAETGNDILIGGLGNDILVGGGGTDQFIFDPNFGNDTLNDFEQGVEQLNFLALSSVSLFSDLTITQVGTDSLITVGSEGTILIKNINSTSWQASDFIFATVGTSGNDTIHGTAGEDTIYGLAGVDALFGEDGEDIIHGGDGDDRIYGKNDADVIYGDDGDDYVQGGSGDDTIYGGDGDDLRGLTGNHGDDVIYGGAGNDLLRGNQGDDDLYGGTGNDALRGDEGDDILHGEYSSSDLQGGGGNDILYGTDEADTKLGGDAGDDILYAGDGNDTNVTGGFGRDLIYGEGGNDKLYGGDSAYSDLYASNNTLYGEDGDDKIYGGNGNDLMDGGLGNDELRGGDGDDIYVLSGGLDYIYDHIESVDTLRLDDWITLQDLTFTVDPTDATDLFVIVTAGIQEVHIENQYTNTTTKRIEFLEFGDGFKANFAEIKNWIHGTSAGETLSGTTGDDVISALGGVNTVNGGDGNDELLGGTTIDTLNGDLGNDVLYGGWGDDTLNGGLGNDTLFGSYGNDALNGGDGDDLYIYTSGHDTLFDSNGTDTLRFGAGISFEDLSFANINTQDVKISLPSIFDTLTIFGQNGATPNVIETLEFADGVSVDFASYTSWITTEYSAGLIRGDLSGDQADFIVGTNNAEDIKGYDFDDIIYGRGGDDDIWGGTGNDLIYGGAGIDKIRGDDGDDIIYAGAGNDVLYGGLGDDIVQGREDDDILYGDDGQDTLKGDSGADQLHGGFGNDDLQGGTGIDVLYGESGDDLLRGNEDNDTLYGGQGDDDLRGGYSDADTYTSNDTLYGESGNDILRGYNGDDLLYGGADQDTLYGGAGADHFYFETATAFNNGRDYLEDFSTVEGDVLHFENILIGYDPLTDALTDFVQSVNEYSDSVISIDRDGLGTAYSFEEVVEVKSTLDIDIDVLKINGSIVV